MPNLWTYVYILYIYFYRGSHISHIPTFSTRSTFRFKE